MLTDKQLFFYQLIEDYYKKYNILPNLNILKKISHYKSYNTIYKYIAILEKNNYLKYNYSKKEITYFKGCTDNNQVYKIPYIDQDKYFQIDSNILTKNKDYFVYKVINNNLQHMGIKKNDIVIIEKNKINIYNKYVLINYKNKYSLFKCEKKDEFTRLLNDIKSINIGTTNNIIGFVVLLIRSSI